MQIEHPIPFTERMVKAIREKRKTQTRRVVKQQPLKWGTVKRDPFELHDAPGIWSPLSDHTEDRMCPYGVPGHHLWVMEKWAKQDGRIVYAADDQPLLDGIVWERYVTMPRMYSRMTLKNTGVRCERLQQISHEDVIAEGITEEDTAIAVERRDTPLFHLNKKERNETAYLWAFIDLWNSINKKTWPWSSNPWVWVVSFVEV